MRLPSFLQGPLRAVRATHLGCALALVASMSGRPTLAGDGGIADGKLDLLVYFTYPEADPVGWQPVFEEYSRLLLNATEGGLQLGTVQFTRCASLADEADVWVLDDMSGARSHIGGLGRRGQHMTISQTHRSTSGFALGQFGLAHESGHYVWSLYDEYLGFVGGLPGTSSQHFCSTPSGVVSCLMDGGTTVYPNNQRTEFCTEGGQGFFATVHNAGVTDAMGRAVVTDQEYVYGTSCWRHIEVDGAAGLLHPPSAPQDVDLVHEPVVFDLERYLGPLAMALLIDTSGSMSGDDRLLGAILGAQVALGLMREGETQAVYAFDDRLRTVTPPQTVTASRQVDAIRKVGALTAAGGTEAGDALLDVATEMADVDGCRRFVVLLTDGVSDDPDVNEAEVLYELARSELVVYPVALGSFPDDVALLELADATGGQYFYAPRPEDVPDVFARIFALAGGGTDVGSFTAPGGLAPGEIARLDVEVPTGAETLVVGLAASADGTPALELRGPRGELVRADAPPPGVERVAAGDVLLLRVPDPSAGPWRLFADVRTAVPHASLHASVEAPRLSVVATADAAVVRAERPVGLEVSVVHGVPVAGASVAGSVVQPDGQRVPVVLVDDGHPASGDRVADDGVYSARFLARGGPGVYRAELRVRSVDGVAASNRECGIYGVGGPEGGAREEGAEVSAVAPFTARATRTFVVTGGDGPPRTGALELRTHPRGDRADGALAFALAVAPEEAVELDRLQLRVPGGAAVLDGLALHLDEDLDGHLDRPRRPLARARVEGDLVVLERGAGPLALLPPGEVVGLLLVDASGLRGIPPQAAGGAGGTVGPVRGRRPVARPVLRPLSLVACSVGLGLWSLVRIARRRRPGARGSRRVSLVTGAAAAAAVGLTLAAGCGTGPGDPGPRALLEPGGVSAAGSRTGAAIPVAGPELVLALRLPAS